MRIVRNIAALIALATVGFAAGDFASHPNPLGAVGLLVLVGICAFLVSYLFRPERAPKAPVADPPAEKPRRAKPEPVWSGWNAEEARVAREQRRERRR